MLLPDADLGSLKAGHVAGADLLSLNQLLHTVAQWRGAVQSLFLLDACRSAVDKGGARDDGHMKANIELVLANMTAREAAIRKSAPAGANAGDARSPSVSILNACANGGQAYEVGELRRSVFSLGLQKRAEFALAQSQPFLLSRAEVAALSEQMQELLPLSLRDRVQRPWLNPEAEPVLLWRPAPKPVVPPPAPPTPPPAAASAALRPGSDLSELVENFERQLEAGQLSWPSDDCCVATLTLMRQTALSAGRLKRYEALLEAALHPPPPPATPPPAAGTGARTLPQKPSEWSLLHIIWVGAAAAGIGWLSVHWRNTSPLTELAPVTATRAAPPAAPPAEVSVPVRAVVAAASAVASAVAGSVVTASPKPAGPTVPPTLDGMSANDIQRLQREAAAQVGMPVAFHDALKDGTPGPVMRVIPAGRFTIGAPDEERKRYVAAGGLQVWADWEKPKSGVLVRAFALGQHEVTRAEFALFVQATDHVVEKGCFNHTGIKFEWTASWDWRNPGFAQNDAHPVVCVNWHDAQAFAQWLSLQTGAAYRLPTEPEWEMAARAGTISRRYWGDDEADQAACAYGNVADKDFDDKFSVAGGFNCRDGFAYTAPVGSKKPNALGLNDMLGNAAEWTGDCFEASYQTLPTDGSVRKATNDCPRVLRGGSWNYNPRILRAANRNRYTPADRVNLTGFRIARTF